VAVTRGAAPHRSIYQSLLNRWSPTRKELGCPFRASRTLFFGLLGEGAWTENSRPALPICAGSTSGSGAAFMPEASSFPIFLRATMPKVQSPDTGEGSGCGRFRVSLPTQCELLESKADMQKRGQASPDGDALALTFAQPVGGGSRRRGRRGRVRRVWRSQQLGVDEVTPPGRDHDDSWE
jgi:hypothetical protein